MNPIREILVPTDFSDLSKRAIEAAVHLARLSKARLLLLHVVESTWYMGTYGLDPLPIPNLEHELRQAAEKRLEELAGELVPADVTRRIVVCEGTPWVDIVRVAQEEDVDMIVLSTHGYTGLKHALLGSHAERVVRTARCPVLTVPARSSD